MLTDIEAILKRSRIEAEEKQQLYNAYASRERAAKVEASWRTRSCPGCGQGIAFKHALFETLMFCKNCSWTLKIPFLMDEARRMDETFMPGITGRPTPTVILKADGTINRIIDL